MSPEGPSFERRRPKPLLGLALGLLTACGLTAIALVLYVLDGGRRFESVSLLQAIAIYFVGGAVGGPVFGVMLPLTARRGGAMLVGAAVALAAYFLVITLFPAAATGSVGAAVVGAIVGFVLWSPPTIESTEDGAV